MLGSSGQVACGIDRSTQTSIDPRRGRGSSVKELLLKRKSPSRNPRLSRQLLRNRATADHSFPEGWSVAVLRHENQSDSVHES